MAFTLRIYAPSSPGYWAVNRPVAGTAYSLPTRLFPADNWWNLNISAAPVDVESDRYILGTPGSEDLVTWDYRGFGLGPAYHSHPAHDWGNNYGLPFCTVGGGHPTVTFTHVSYTLSSDHIGYPIPEAALTVPGWTEDLAGTIDNPVSAGDRHLLIYNTDNQYLYEIYQPYHNATSAPVTYRTFTVLPGEYACASCCYWDTNTNHNRPLTWTSSDAAGLQVLPGLVKYDEIVGTDPITHAHRICVAHASYQDPHFAWPGTHEAGNYTYDQPPLGARLRLRSSFDMSGLAGSYYDNTRKLIQSFKDYGLIVVDNGGHGQITGTNDARWGSSSGALRVEIINALNQVLLSDFEVVQLGWRASFLDDGPYHLVTMGDSKTVYGNQAGGFALQLKTALETATGASWGSSYYAVNSSTLIGQVDTSLAAIIAQVPDTAGLEVIVVINWGVNEMYSLPTEADWLAHYKQLIAAIQAKNPLAKCIVTKPWYLNHDLQAATMGGWIDTLVRFRPGFIFEGPDELVWLKSTDNGATMTTDGTHYSTAGHAALCTLLRAIITA